MVSGLSRENGRYDGDRRCMVCRVPLCADPGMPPAEAAVWGNAAGALCTTEIGTTAGLRNREQTEAFIKAH